MDRDKSDIYRQALDLGDSDRADLAVMLLESLDPAFEEDAEAAWLAEVERRIQDVDSGATQTIPWDMLKTRLVGNDRA